MTPDRTVAVMHRGIGGGKVVIPASANPADTDCTCSVSLCYSEIGRSIAFHFLATKVRAGTPSKNVWHCCETIPDATSSIWRPRHGSHTRVPTSASIEVRDFIRAHRAPSAAVPRLANGEFSEETRENFGVFPPEIMAWTRRIFNGVFLLATLEQEEMVRDGREDELERIGDKACAFNESVTNPDS